ncbi:MAG: 50S ribosomal protein L7/L12 [Lachnospiraceae bacterium]
MAKLTTEEFIAAIKELSVLELNELVKACEEEFGVSAAAGVVVAAAGGAADTQEEEQTEFSIELTEVGPNKVRIIKIVRDYAGLGLKEAKDLVDSAPSIIKEGVTKAEADDLIAKLAEEGAKGTAK